MSLLLARSGPPGMSAIWSLTEVNRTWPREPNSVVNDPGCVKTRLGEEYAELFSQLPSSERSCQYNRLPHRRNRDGSSTRKLDIGVFTQPGPEAEIRFDLDQRDRTSDVSTQRGRKCII